MLGEPAVALEVVHPERRLDEEHVVGRPRLDHRQRAIGIVPGVADVDHDRELRPGRLTHGADRLDHPLVALIQALVGIGPEISSSSFAARKPRPWAHATWSMNERCRSSQSSMLGSSEA